MKQRLQKILSRAGIASRRSAEKLIEEGRVAVDGEVVTTLGASADPEAQDIRLDGSRVKPPRPRRYVMLHKPAGYVTTRSDPGRRPTVMELLPPADRHLFPVGRLDMASTGLLLLTDDGELAERLTHPRYGVPKTYLVIVAGSPDRAALARASRGIVVEGERLRVERPIALGSRPVPRKRRGDGAKPRTRLRVTLRQGKNREIRRLFRALGFPVLALHRERVGGLSLRGLPPGAHRVLTPKEVERLSGASEKKPGPRERRTRRSARK